MSEALKYPKGDLRKMLSVLAAIDVIQTATLVKIVAKTGLDKKTVTTLIAKAQVEAGVLISKERAVYTIEDWGPVLKRAGCRLALQGQLGNG